MPSNAITGAHMNYLIRQAGVATMAAILLASAACQSLNKEAQGGVIGAAGGAVVGGVVGHATGSTARGAIIGAAVGGAAGAIIGHQMDQKAKEIQQTVAGATVTRVGEGLVVTFESGLLFDFDSDQLREASKSNLDNLAKSLSQFGDSKLLLVGHTDDKGTETYNLDLSRRRAAAVGSYLSARGVPSARIATSGRGEAEPVAPNDNDADRQKNRRVEVAISAGDEMKAQAKAQAGASN
jgi:outer membrane protein OmpA-like peptidoglycan-associated protein